MITYKGSNSVSTITIYCEDRTNILHTISD